MAIYIPRHQTQVNAADPNGRYNCTAYAAAMAIDAATLGGCVPSGANVRALSDEPVPSPQSPGLNVPQVCAVAARLHVTLTDRSGFGVQRLVEWVEAGHAAVVQVDRTTLGNYLCSASIDVPHAVLVLDFSPGRSSLVFDPLCTAPKWVPPDVLQQAAVDFGAQTGLREGAIRFAVTRHIPRIL